MEDPGRLGLDLERLGRCGDLLCRERQRQREREREREQERKRQREREREREGGVERRAEEERERVGVRVLAVVRLGLLLDRRSLGRNLYPQHTTLNPKLLETRKPKAL